MTLSAVLKLLGGVRASVFAAIAALLFVFGAVQSYRLWLANTKVELLEIKAKFAESALAELKAESAAQKARAEDALAKYEQEKKKNGTAVIRTLTKVEKIYATDKQSGDWSSTRVPDAIVGELRQ